MHLEDFEKLGDKLEAEWRLANYDEAVSPAVAAEGLRAASLPDKYTAWQVLQ